VDLSLADVLVAGLAAILGWFVASRSYRLDAATAAADWIRDLRAWANEAIDVLAEAAYHSPRGENGPVSDAVLKQCRWQLSALIDRGRLLLPNNKSISRGFRNLERIVACYMRRSIRWSPPRNSSAAKRIGGGSPIARRH